MSYPHSEVGLARLGFHERRGASALRAVAALGALVIAPACETGEFPAVSSVAPSASESVSSSVATTASAASESSATQTSEDGSAGVTSEPQAQSSTEASTSANVEDSDAETATSTTIDLGSTDTESASDADASTSDATSGDTETSTLRLTSPVLVGSVECTTSTPDTCNLFPDDNISYMENANISPRLDWEGVPEGTLSFAVTLKDVTFGQPLWAIWNIPMSETGLPEDLPSDTAVLTMPEGAEQSNASFADGDGYVGPEAPCNVFQFELFALSVATFEPNYKEYAAEVDAQLNLLGDVILGRATLAGRTKYNSTCE